MNPVWSSSDKSVRKGVLAVGFPSEKPTERAICSIHIKNIKVTGLSIEDLRSELGSEYLAENTERVIVIGDSGTEIDRYIDRAVQMMHIREHSLVTINLSHPYGSSIEDIFVELEITLMEYEPYRPIWEWTPEEKYKIAMIYKGMGVELYKSSRDVDAFHKFSKACKILITLEPMKDLGLEAVLEKNIQDLRITLYNNMAGCHLKRKNFDHAITLCNKVIDKNENNVKALYRRAVAYGNLKDFEKASVDMEKVVSLEPTNTVAREKFHIFRKYVNEAKQRYDNIVRRMFDV